MLVNTKLLNLQESITTQIPIKLHSSLRLSLGEHSYNAEVSRLTFAHAKGNLAQFNNLEFQNKSN